MEGISLYIGDKTVAGKSREPFSMAFIPEKVSIITMKYRHTGQDAVGLGVW